MLIVVATAKPTDIAGPGIIIVMGLGPLCAADLTGLRVEDADTLGGFDIEVREVAPGIFPAPLLLAGEGLCQSASPTSPVIPSSDNSCRT